MNLSSSDGVYVIDFGEGDNRMTHAFMDEVADLLDRVDAAPGPKALVTTATGRIYCNGLDVEHMSAHPDDVAPYVSRTMRLCSRLLTYPAPTAAAINGHAFGLGAFAALSHDHRVMRADRGYICWPEISLDMTFPPPLQALNLARLDPVIAHEAMVTGRRYGGVDATSARIVHRAVPLEDVVSDAIEMVAPLRETAGDTLGTIKRDLYRPVIDQLEADPR